MNKRTIEEIEDKLQEKKRIPKEVSQEIMKRLFINLLKAIGIMICFVILNLIYVNLEIKILNQCIEIIAGGFLIAGLIGLEIAYKKDSGTIAITGIESLVISFFILSATHMATLMKYNFRFYVLTFSYIFSTYYVLKCIIIYTKERRKYLESLSDISDIVREDKPIIKEAKKRNNITQDDKDENGVEESKELKSIKKKRTSTKTSKKTNSKVAKKKTEELKK